MTKKYDKKIEDKRGTVIKVEGLTKTFRIPHEKHTSLKSAALNAFEKKTYEEFVALKDISFEVKKGEFFGIIGRNGSGKSTLLKILAGIYMADEGTVDIKGKLSPFLELGVGFNPELTGRENVFLGGSILGLSRKEIAEKFDKIVNFSEIGEFIDMKMKNYSSGMQVRLAFSLAINAHAEILLMDEVLAVGDSNFQAKCLKEFNKYRDQGKTVVLVSHDVGTIQRYCDRAMLLRNGKIIKIGKAEAVVDEYIYQNIADEEKKIKEEEKNKGKDVISDETEGSKLQKDAEITKVEFLDKDGKEKNVFETGEPLGIKIKFKINKKINGFNIGVGLYSEINERIFGYNTEVDGFKINKESNFIVLNLDKLSILKGRYYLNVACFGDTEQTYYDIKQKNKELTIFTPGIKNNYKGFCDIDHRWNRE